MSGSEFAWGLVLVSTGIFISVYGTILFRFALAAMGFGVGFIAVMRIFDSSVTATHVLIAFAAGGIGAILLYSLVSLSLYMAGGIFGLVLGVGAAGVIDLIGPRPQGVIAAILALAGVGLGAFFAKRMGSLVTMLATASAGAFMIVSGLTAFFASTFKNDISDPTSTLSQKLSLTIFVIFFAMTALTHYRTRQKVRVIR